MRVLLVGVSGKAGHGKDTLSDIISNSFEKDVDVQEKIYFAGQLKRAVQEVFDLNYDDVWDEKGKERPIEHLGGITGGEVLQKFGTDVARNIYQDIWIYHYLKDLKSQIGFNDDVDRMIIYTPDVRFPNEFNTVMNAYNGKMPRSGISFKSMLVRVVRPGHKTKRDPNHPSEIALDNEDRWNHIVVAKNLVQLEYAASPIITDIKEYFSI